MATKALVLRIREAARTMRVVNGIVAFFEAATLYAR